jgi:hypothetical protein
VEEFAEVSLPIGGVEIWARCYPNDVDEAKLILEQLAQFVSQGYQLSENNPVIVGWSQLTIAPYGPKLYLREPDYGSGNPVNSWVPQLNVTIDVARQQGALLNPLGLDPDPVLFDWMVTHAPNVFSVQKIFMQRHNPAFLGDSGWQIGPLEGAQAAAPTERTPLYQLLTSRPAIVTASAIPKDYLVILHDNSLEAILDKSDRNILFQPYTQAGRQQAMRRVSDKFGES